MALLDKLRQIFSSPREATDFQGVRPGAVILKGVVRDDDEFVISPIRRKSCVAFFYRSTWEATANGQSITRKVEDAEVYAPSFWLTLEGGRVLVRPTRSDNFGADNHLELLQSGMPGFQAEEQVIRNDDVVRITGRIRDDGEHLVLEPRYIELLQAARVSPPKAERKQRRATRSTARRQKKKRKNKKTKKRKR